MAIPTAKAKKRAMIALPLWILFGFLCAYLAWSNAPVAYSYWQSAMTWTIVSNRLLIGLFVCIAWVFRYHPVFGCRFHPVLRWACIGAVVSLTLAIGALIQPIQGATMIFVSTIVAGIVYGIIIDVLATKFGGEGKDLIPTE